jgi:hypothetical protein
MKLTLDELTAYVKKTLPNSKLITNIEQLEKSNAIKFKWNKHEFIVKTDLSTLELKNKKNLFITGTSSLIQSALRSTDTNSRSIEKICELLEQAEKNVHSALKREIGRREVETVKTILTSLISKY